MLNWPPSSSCVMPSTVTGTTPYHHNDLKHLFMHDAFGDREKPRCFVRVAAFSPMLRLPLVEISTIVIDGTPDAVANILSRAF
jgi:hypothetical protein